MKRAELIIGKAYYTSTSANWRDDWRADASYFKTAKQNQHKRDRDQAFLVLTTSISLSYMS